MSGTDHRGPGIPGSVAHFDDFDSVAEWLEYRGFVEHADSVIDVQMSVDPTGVFRLDDYTTEETND